MADGGSDRRPDGLPVLGLCCHAGRLFADGRGAERPHRDRQPAGGQSGLHSAAGAGALGGAERPLPFHSRPVERMALAGIPRRSVLAVGVAAAGHLCGLPHLLHPAGPVGRPAQPDHDHCSAGGVHLAAGHLPAAVRDVPGGAGVHPEHPAGPGKPASGRGIPPLYGAAGIHGADPPPAA